MTDEPTKSKTCTRCKETKPETAFHRNGAQGRSSTCAECRAAIRRTRGREKRNRPPEQELKERMQRIYNMTVEQLDALTEAQGGVCAICGKSAANGRRLAIDHCHATGVVRALLCTRCNLNVGVYEAHHRAVAEYLATYGRGNPLMTIFVAETESRPAAA